MKQNLVLLGILAVLAIVAGVMMWTGGTKTNSTLADKPLLNFAIQDTSQVSKIVISDRKSNSIIMERQTTNRLWKLNEEYLVKDSYIELILRTLNNLEYRSAVKSAAVPTVLGRLETSGNKVEVYQGDKLYKTYLVGTNTADRNGTYMVLETEEGRSPEPAIIKATGKHGSLNQMFTTEVNEIRFSGVFNYPGLNIQEIEVKNLEDPNESFKVEYKGGNDIELFHTASNRYADAFDTLAVKEYLLTYKKVHCESHDSKLEVAEEDSIRNSIPAFEITVTNNNNEVKSIDLHWAYLYDNSGDPGVGRKNQNFMLGVIPPDDVVRLQRFTFDHLMLSFSQFSPKLLVGQE